MTGQVGVEPSSLEGFKQVGQGLVLVEPKVANGSFKTFKGDMTGQVLVEPSSLEGLTRRPCRVARSPQQLGAQDAAQGGPSGSYQLGQAKRRKVNGKACAQQCRTPVVIPDAAPPRPKLGRGRRIIYNIFFIFNIIDNIIPVVPHKAVAEVSKIGNL